MDRLSVPMIVDNYPAQRSRVSMGMGHAIKERFYADVAFPCLQWIYRTNPLVIYYHAVADETLPHLASLYSFSGIAKFEQDLETILRSFQPFSLSDLLTFVRDNRKPPPNSFLLTFDDGLKECAEVIAPILKRKGIPATFFVCSAFVDNQELAYDHKKSLLADLIKKGKASSAQETKVRSLLEQAGIFEGELSAGLLSIDYRRRYVLDPIAAAVEYDFSKYLQETRPYLGSKQIRGLLADGHAIGAHSIDHPRYGDLPFSEQIEQTRKSVRFVRERFHLGYGAFSFPHSDANVSVDFFREIFGQGEVDVCFGNQGLLNERVAGVVQRSSMEKTTMAAQGILGRDLMRRMVRTVSGRLTVRRN